MDTNDSDNRAMSLRIVIIGYGRMGKEVDSLAEAAPDIEVVERLDIDNNGTGQWIDPDRLANVDVAVDFSTANATMMNVPRLAESGTNVVIGTTGWNDRENELKQMVEHSDIGAVVAANFSLGVNLFQEIVERSAALFKSQDEYGAWIHEAHHSAKIDAPSGTAIRLEQAARKGGYEAMIDVSSTRVGSIPGTHTVGFDGPFDTITLTHTARSRASFAGGALEAARWISGRKGWFTMRDVLGLD